LIPPVLVVLLERQQEIIVRIKNDLKIIPFAYRRVERLEPDLAVDRLSVRGGVTNDAQGAYRHSPQF
jgi:hypothetical protein